MDRNMDLIVIGAGPAGLSAACAARACGLDVTLVDEQAAPGGQLFRNIETPMAQALLDPKERSAGLGLVKRFRESGATYYPGTTVWGLEPHRVSCTMNGKAEELAASHIIVAPGGMERPVPFPGWTLPGVMGAGGADILLRSGGTLSADKNAPVVLAGNGPLLLLLAGHLLEAGVPIAAWLVVPPHHGGRAHARWRARHAVCRQGHENGTARTQGQSADHPQRHQYPRRGLRSSGKGRVRRGRQDPRNQRLHPAAPRGHHPAHAHPQFPERQARMGRRPAVLASRRRRKRPHQRGRHFHRR